MINKKNFEILKDKYSNFSSWTIWADDDGIHPKSGIDDLSVFENLDLSELNSDYIFVCLNGAEHQRVQKEWCSFHSSDLKRSQDYKLRFALKNTKYWGCYVTDFIKEIEMTDGSKLLKIIKSNPSIIDKNKRMLDEEISLLGNPTIIAVGEKVYSLLSDVYGEKRGKMLKIMHYSSRITKEKYKEAIFKVL